MHFRYLTLMFAISATLSACGGGSSAPSAAAPIPDAPSPLPGIPPPFALNISKLTATAVVGNGKSAVFYAENTATLPPVIHVKVETAEPVIDPTIEVQQLATDGSYMIVVKTAATLKVGLHTGKITVNVCKDAQCASHVPGSPFQLPYEITVRPTEGAMTPSTLSALSPMPGAPDWTTFQGNAAHTAHVPVTLSPASFSPRWKMVASADKGEQTQFTHLVTGAGQLYVSSNSSSVDRGRTEVLAYAEHDGSLKWKRTFEHPNGRTRVFPPAYSAGTVHVIGGADSDTSVYAFDAATGREIYKSKKSGRPRNPLAPTVDRGTVFTLNESDNRLYKWNFEDKNTAFKTDLPGVEGWTPAVDANNIYAYVVGSLLVRDRLDGRVKASIADPVSPDEDRHLGGTPVIGSGNTVFAGLFHHVNENALVAFDTVKQSVRWSAKGRLAGNPAYADGQVFMSNNLTRQLEVRSELDGAIIWTWPVPPATRLFGSVIVTDNLVFVSTTLQIIAIDRKTHATVWAHAASGNLSLSAQGVLYIVRGDVIEAINLK